MVQTASSYTAAMSPQQTAWFSAEYDSVRKEETTGALFAFFLGTFGAHRFYLGQSRLGILYAVFFWTGIPTLCGFVESFLMPARVRAFNFAQATVIAARIGAGPIPSSVPPTPHCTACGQHLDSAAVFCTRCGASLRTEQQPQPVTA